MTRTILFIRRSLPALAAAPLLSIACGGEVPLGQGLNSSSAWSEGTDYPPFHDGSASPEGVGGSSSSVGKGSYDASGSSGGGVSNASASVSSGVSVSNGFGSASTASGASDSGASFAGTYCGGAVDGSTCSCTGSIGGHSYAVACSNVVRTCSCSVDGANNDLSLVGISACPVGAGTSNDVLQVWANTCGFPQ